MQRFPLVMLLAFAVTLFTSATLLFLVQPMIGKIILPLLGGTPEVWNTCMVFFQAMLLAGYAYAHATTRWLGVRRQARLHLGVLFLPVLLFALVGPIAVNRNLIVGGGNPIAGVLLVLLIAVGLPFFVVSTTSPLLQQWFSSTDHPAARDPYFLSTASNMGSMLALVGYPALVEPFLPLRGQRYGWSIGYGLYMLLTSACAVLLWKSGMAVAEAAGSTLVLAGAASSKVPAGRPQSKGRNRKEERSERVVEAPKMEPANDTALTGAVTTWRRMRWVLLAFVPSSLMMGVTTFITTDLAAIPLLWVLPLGLYLFSFILVFAKMPRWFHQTMILAMPLLVLLLVFMMLSEIKPDHIGYSIALHLTLLFTVAMVCHGEMVRDRPPTKYLTEFYMWMSFGGVLGGIFNALIAPVIFNSLAEYALALVVACLLLPPLIPNEAEDEPVLWGRYVDLTFVGLFTILGLVLIWLRLRDTDPIPFSRLKEGGWGWSLSAVLLTLSGGTVYVLRSRDERDERGLDIVLPFTLALLTVGLVWGLTSDALFYRIESLSTYTPLTAKRLRIILTYGLPAVLCYTFVERSLRFGLGVGAILLAGSFTNLFAENTIYAKRSYFGVLKVEVRQDPRDDTVYVDKNTASPLLAARLAALAEKDDELKQKIEKGERTGLLLINHRLVHGTTLHGQQFQMHQLVVPLMAAETVGSGFGDPLSLAIMAAAGSTEDYSEQALTYYHRTGPIGHVMQAFNRSAADRIGVIGLGTGTLACYGRPGQRVVFYDIDKMVKDISFDRRDYFTFISDARARGVRVDPMVLGDARLEIERWVERDRQLAEAGKERDTHQGDYTVLAVDAFSSDAIPIHLITREAVHLFMQMVREDGVLAYHVSNRYLDLKPVLANIAEQEGLVVYSESDSTGLPYMETIGRSAATWVVLARKEKSLDRLVTEADWNGRRHAARETLLPLLVLPDGGTGLQLLPWAIHGLLGERARRLEDSPERKALPLVDAPWQPLKPDPDVGVWTDDYSNLLKVFVW